MDLTGLPVGEGVRRRLEGVLARPAHAYILSSPSRTVLDAVAGHLAAAFVCSGTGGKPCGVCPHCRKAAGNIHPDIQRIAVPEDKRNILVEQVRQMRADAYIRPNEADRKVFLIEDAQTMRTEAQNALLKVLEDGPAYAAFLLLTDNEAQLLPTIRSRCEVLSLASREENACTLDEDLQQKARELADLLTGEDERLLAEYAVGLESRKWDRDELVLFLNAAEDALHGKLARDPARVLPKMEHLRTVRQAIRFNISAGHVFGWLAAGTR